MDETQPFVPFRPYAWGSYPGPGLRPLIHQSLHPSMDVDRGPTTMAFYGDRSTHSALYADRTLGDETNYGDYRRHAAALLFPEGSLHDKSHNLKAQSDLLCSSLILNGAYKCIKCSKVRMEMHTPCKCMDDLYSPLEYRRWDLKQKRIKFSTYKMILKQKDTAEVSHTPWLTSDLFT